jgi:hypothetical protein
LPACETGFEFALCDYSFHHILMLTCIQIIIIILYQWNDLLAPVVDRFYNK